MKTKKEETLDVTPTWTALMPVMLDNLHQPLVREEIVRMIDGVVLNIIKVSKEGKSLNAEKRGELIRHTLKTVAKLADEFNGRGGA